MLNRINFNERKRFDSKFNIDLLSILKVKRSTN